MSKPRMRFHDGLWWCWRRGAMGGAIGCGQTQREAWDEMQSIYWQLYRQETLERSGPFRAA